MTITSAATDVIDVKVDPTARENRGMPFTEFIAAMNATLKEAEEKREECRTMLNKIVADVQAIEDNRKSEPVVVLTQAELARALFDDNCLALQITWRLAEVRYEGQRVPPERVQTVLDVMWNKTELETRRVYENVAERLFKRLPSGYVCDVPMSPEDAARVEVDIENAVAGPAFEFDATDALEKLRPHAVIVSQSKRKETEER